jgi:hypothetical protein
MLTSLLGVTRVAVLASCRVSCRGISVVNAQERDGGGDTPYERNRMAMRLGPIERAILVACLQKRRPERWGRFAPDLLRSELPTILWNWVYVRDPRWSHGRPGGYRNIPPAEYRSKQASLTRALQTLYAKQLIDAGKRDEATNLSVYSARRAAQLGIVAEQPRDEATMRAIHRPLTGHGRPWSYRSTGEKPRAYRNMRGIRLTEAGVTLATQLLETLNR